ncbi:unnamed protein product [Cylicostephanus goldi]|uniref:Uncharacterized protein n=1 Tax=Cylicostephanus goldi TaxID=71465 RepID=A0A3P7NXH3_CYLGO|nr:unnamed protein product [Cylicostephanus goldi]
MGSSVETHILEPVASDSGKSRDWWPNPETISMDAVDIRKPHRTSGIPHRYAEQSSRTSTKVRNNLIS